MMQTQVRIWVLAAGVCVGLIHPARTQAPASSSVARDYQEAVTLMESQGDCRKAIPLFARVADGPDRALAARALISGGVCEERLGRAGAAAAYRSVIERFPEQRSAVAEARRRLAALAPRAAPIAPTPTLRATWPARPSDMVTGGAASLDGRTIAGLDAEGDVILFDLRTGTRLRRVARAGDGSTGVKPVPAPDGRAVAFTWVSQAGAIELRVATDDTTRPRTLLRAAAGEAFLVQDWSLPTRLLLQRTAPSGEVSLAVLDVATGRSIATVRVAGAATSARLSPDGRFIAFDEPEERTTGRRVRVVRLADGTTTATLDGPADDGTVAWTPSGDAVLLVSDRSGTFDLWAWPAAEGRALRPPQLLQRDIGMLIDLVGVTSDGAFHYNRQVGVVDVFVMTFHEGQPPSGSVRAVPATRVGSNLMPSFSSDGTSVTFVTQHPYSSTLEEFSLEDGRTRARRVAAGYARRPAWAPNGSVLLVRGATGDARYGFLAVDPRTNAMRPLVTVSENDDGTLGPGGWTHDSAVLVYAMADGVIRRHVIATGKTEEWFGLPPASRPIAVLPSPRDERVALVLAGPRETRLSVRTSDGAWLDLVTVPAPGRVLSAAWLPDATALVYSVTRQGSGLAWLMRVPVGGGAPESLGVSAEGLRDLAMSPTGRHLAWTAGWPRREPWVLEHVVPARR